MLHILQPVNAPSTAVYKTILAAGTVEQPPDASCRLEANPVLLPSYWHGVSESAVMRSVVHSCAGPESQSNFTFTGYFLQVSAQRWKGSHFH